MIHTVEKLWHLNPTEKAHNVVDVFFTRWNQYTNRKNVPLGLVLAKSFWVELLYSCLLKLVYNAMLFSIPELLRSLIHFVKHPSQEAWKGYLFAVLFLVASAIQTFSIGHYFHHCNIFGLRMRTALMGAVYRKVRTPFSALGGRRVLTVALFCAWRLRFVSESVHFDT